MRTVQPRYLGRKKLRIPVSPTSPKPSLAAITAQVRTTSRKLNDSCPTNAPILIVVPVFDQLPANPSIRLFLAAAASPRVPSAGAARTNVAPAVESLGSLDFYEMRLARQLATPTV